MSDIVIQLHAARAASEKEAELDRQVIRLQIQLGALIDHIVAEAMFLWLSRHETSPTDKQIADEEARLRRHYTGVAAAATQGRRAQP
ncbi:hypothetical protein [Lentzea cavernae]|uniref:Uncharacterized protein n=1 Tax=Lentzea cavernae TaxID=2020703 RepID=A0ABQ3MU62_9PSEU|nr:hypothetical protein [Lentzea cavernae]GHH57523.1 hypothetical protein GCM10017774_77160 [Lentzea cavernae]